MRTSLIGDGTAGEGNPCADLDRATHKVVGEGTGIDGESSAIVWTADDAAKVLAFIRACASKEHGDGAP